MQFVHNNVIRYDNRPFDTITQMDEVLINNWNARISDKDTVYVLGDAFFKGEERSLEILRQLKGHKHLIKGNHDRVKGRLGQEWESIQNYAEITDGEYFVVMSHYPMIFYNRQHYGAVMLYGHVHNTREWNSSKNGDRSYGGWIFPRKSWEDFDTQEEFKETVRKWRKQRKIFRINHVSWWAEELPSDDEIKIAERNLEKVNFEVDYVLSHCAPQSIVSWLMGGYTQPDKLTMYFEDLAQRLKFKNWFFGHYHDDRKIMGKFILLYDQIVRIQ